MRPAWWAAWQMALDHTRDFFGSPVAVTATLPLFFTRWITHFCAPVFMMLAGTSAYIMSQRKTKGDSQMDQEGVKGHLARRYRPARRRAQPGWRFTAVAGFPD